jgi:uncharacterized membrane-anchored protein YhcB (DUF1043 family)
MSEKPQQTSGGSGWKVAAVGILIAVVIGLIMIAIGAAKVRRGAQMQKEAESRLLIALDYAVEQAGTEAKSVDDALLKSNWGDASIKLGQLAATVALIEQVAPARLRGDVQAVKDALAKVQQAVAEQSKDWRDRLDELRAAISSLGEER